MTVVAHAQMRGLRGTCKEVPNGVHAPCAPVTPPIHSKVMPTGACPCGEQPHGWCATWVPEPRGPSLPNNGAQLGLIIIGNHSAILVAVAVVHLIRSAPSPPPNLGVPNALYLFLSHYCIFVETVNFVWL